MEVLPGARPKTYCRAIGPIIGPMGGTNMVPGTWWQGCIIKTEGMTLTQMTVLVKNNAWYNDA